MLRTPDMSGNFGIDPIEAWRVWGTDGRMLISPYQCEIWYPGEAHKSDDVPSTDNHFGLYGVPTLSDLLKNQSEIIYIDPYGKATSEAERVRNLAWKPFHGSSAMRYVYGRVKFWGVVQEHEGGYRAQYGYPASISDDCLARAYGIEKERPIIRYLF